jgi:hypothetical protein
VVEVRNSIFGGIVYCCYREEEVFKSEPRRFRKLPNQDIVPFAKR